MRHALTRSMRCDDPDLSDFSDSAIDLARRGELCTIEAVPSSASLPERALLRAVLQEAILDVRGYATGMSRSNRRRVAQDAYYWILSRNVTWPFSFENVCAVLGFDAECLRQWLLQHAAVGGPAAGAGTHDGTRSGALRAVRAARMRGNQQKQPLWLSRALHAPAVRPCAANGAVGESDR